MLDIAVLEEMSKEPYDTLSLPDGPIVTYGALTCYFYKNWCDTILTENDT